MPDLPQDPYDYMTARAEAHDEGRAAGKEEALALVREVLAAGPRSLTHALEEIERRLS